MTLVGDAAHPMPPCESDILIHFKNLRLTLISPQTDRGQGLNHCICDVSYLLSALSSILSNQSTFSAAISAYDEEVVPRGGEEVKCSVENGFMLHDWQKVMESPVFRNGFKPMTGHDDAEVEKKEEEERGVWMSEHAEVQIKREKEEKEAVGNLKIAAH